jgi:DNA-binding Lrp family transcriptional regulator
MKLSSPPTRHAFTSVIAAAMKYGPTRVSRIAYELDMPVETCRYYLKRFHNAGFRFVLSVDYRALGLQPTILFIRFSKNLYPAKRDNFLRWLDTVYTVYRANLGNELEYYIESVPPHGEVKSLKSMLEVLVDAKVLDKYNLFEVRDGYYKPDWVTHYDFTKDCWGEELDIEIPKIPLSHMDGKAGFDLTDLLILSYLERNPSSKMNDISQKLGISPQLVGYHREKHVEGLRLVTGYIPSRSTKHADLKIQFLLGHLQEQKETSQYLHRLTNIEYYDLFRLHTPADVKLAHKGEIVLYSVNPVNMMAFTVPVEHFLDKKWVKVETFVETLEKIIRVV